MNGEDLHGTEVEQGGSSNYKEGTDYHILQRVRVMDQENSRKACGSGEFLVAERVEALRWHPMARRASLYERERGLPVVGHLAR